MGVWHYGGGRSCYRVVCAAPDSFACCVRLTYFGAIYVPSGLFDRSTLISPSWKYRDTGTHLLEDGMLAACMEKLICLNNILSHLLMNRHLEKRIYIHVDGSISVTKNRIKDCIVDSWLTRIEKPVQPTSQHIATVIVKWVNVWRIDCKRSRAIGLKASEIHTAFKPRGLVMAWGGGRKQLKKWMCVPPLPKLEDVRLSL